MNAEMRDVLWEACRGRGMSDWVFPNPLTGLPYTDFAADDKLLLERRGRSRRHAPRWSVSEKPDAVAITTDELEVTIRRSPLLIEFRDAKSKALINARIKVVVTVVYPLKHVFDTACTNAGIEGFRWHDLRATFGTRLGAAGVGMRTIMDLMGHRDPKTCLRYVRATEPAKREAVRYAFQRPGHKSDTPHLVAV